MTPYDSNGHWYSDDPMQRDDSGFFAALKDKNHAEVIGKLTAEIERLTAIVTEQQNHLIRIVADNERLRAEMDQRMAAYVEYQERDEADNEQLRAALTDMLKHFKQYEDAECCKRVFAHARRALEPKP